MHSPYQPLGNFHVQLGKGRIDRYVILPQQALIILRRYWATHRHPRFIFPAGKNAAERFRAVKTMSESGVQRTIRLIARDAKISIKVTTHTLRHCYATHLLERGLSLRHIQQQRGHESIKTTLVYTKLTEPAEQLAITVINEMIDQLPSKFDARD